MGEQHPTQRERIQDRQKKILEYIVSYWYLNSFPPSIEEIREHCEISSKDMVHRDLKALEELDAIRFGSQENGNGNRRRPNRSIRVLWEGAALLGVRPPNYVPLLGKIVAGEPINVDPDDARTAEEWVEVPREVVGSGGRHSRLFALTAKGYSMVDAGVLDGDIVVLDSQAVDGLRSQLVGQGKKIMAAVWIKGDDETTLKYVSYEEGGKIVRLTPANPAYTPFTRPAESVDIQGVVVWVSRSPKMR